MRNGGGLLLILGLLVAGYLWWKWIPLQIQQPHVVLRLSAGSREGTRYLLAEEIRRKASHRGITLNLVRSAGSEEALQQIQRGELDLALIQGGLELVDFPSVTLVTPLHIEPLHLLAKRECSESLSTSLENIQGLKVNISVPGSGTYALSVAVLEFVGLYPASGLKPEKGEYLPVVQDYEELLAETDRSRLPDVVFTVSTLPSRVAKHLITRFDYRIVPIPFASAMALSALTDDSPRANRADPASFVLREHIEESYIPAFTYDIEPDVPEKTIPTIGTRLILVAHEHLDPRDIEQVIEAVFSSRFARVLHPPLTPDVLKLPPLTRLHSGASSYLKRNQPLIAGDVIDLTDKWLSILGVTTGGLLFLWQWYRRRQRIRQESGFESYILKLAEIEQKAGELELAPSLDLPRLFALREKMQQLKREALMRFAAGEIEGEELMSGFLSHASDVRDHLTRLILHQREYLEELAQAQGRSPEVLWREMRLGITPSTCDNAPSSDVGTE